MNKYTFPDGAPDILNEKLSVEEYYDILTDAWLEAEMSEGIAAPPMFRKALFYLLDKKINERKKL